MNITDIDRIFNSATVEDTFFSITHNIFENRKYVRPQNKF